MGYIPRWCTGWVGSLGEEVRGGEVELEPGRVNEEHEKFVDKVKLI